MVNLTILKFCRLRYDFSSVSESRLTASHRVSELTSGSVNAQLSAKMKLLCTGYTSVSESRLTASYRVSELASGSVKGAAFSCCWYA